MTIPDYWLRRPDFQCSVQQQEELHSLYQGFVQPAKNFLIEPIGVPKWVFLNWLCEGKGLLLHGSCNPSIDRFEPRTPNAKDDDEFSQQRAVFAASDGIWAMFYAVLDRAKFRLRMLNAALQFELTGGCLSEMRYFFSVSQEALEQYPWCEGVVYVLPREGFIKQPQYRLGPWTVHDPHWANANPVYPLARVQVRPEDFPFLHQVRAHDDEILMERVRANPSGFPWLDEPILPQNTPATGRG